VEAADWPQLERRTRRFLQVYCAIALLFSPAPLASPSSPYGKDGFDQEARRGDAVEVVRREHSHGRQISVAARAGMTRVDVSMFSSTKPAWSRLREAGCAQLESGRDIAAFG
jgi:hypothetical protein